MTKSIKVSHDDPGDQINISEQLRALPRPKGLSQIGLSAMSDLIYTILRKKAQGSTSKSYRTEGQ
jgi:hypothetical protein